MFPKIKIWILLNLVVIAVEGCNGQAARVADKAADRQAQQNTTMAELNKEVAAGTHHLVEADAQARQEIVGVHRDLQAERIRLDTSWRSLEKERQEIAAERRTESMLVPATKFIGGVLLATALLGFCWYALVAAHRNEEVDAALNEWLVGELVSAEPNLLSSGSRLSALPRQSPPDTGHDE